MPHGVTFVIYVSLNVTHSSAVKYVCSTRVTECHLLQQADLCLTPHWWTFSQVQQANLISWPAWRDVWEQNCCLPSQGSSTGLENLIGRSPALFTSHLKISLTKLIKIHSLSWPALKITDFIALFAPHIEVATVAESV